MTEVAEAVARRQGQGRPRQRMHAPKDPLALVAIPPRTQHTQRAPAQEDAAIGCDPNLATNPEYLNWAQHSSPPSRLQTSLSETCTRTLSAKGRVPDRPVGLEASRHITISLRLQAREACEAAAGVLATPPTSEKRQGQ